MGAKLFHDNFLYRCYIFFLFVFHCLSCYMEYANESYIVVIQSNIGMSLSFITQLYMCIYSYISFRSRFPILLSLSRTSEWSLSFITQWYVYIKIYMFQVKVVDSVRIVYTSAIARMVWHATKTLGCALEAAMMGSWEHLMAIEETGVDTGVKLVIVLQSCFIFGCNLEYLVESGVWNA